MEIIPLFTWFYTPRWCRISSINSSTWKWMGGIRSVSFLGFGLLSGGENVSFRECSRCPCPCDVCWCLEFFVRSFLWIHGFFVIKDVFLSSTSVAKCGFDKKFAGDFFVGYLKLRRQYNSKKLDSISPSKGWKWTNIWNHHPASTESSSWKVIPVVSKGISSLGETESQLPRSFCFSIISWLTVKKWFIIPEKTEYPYVHHWVVVSTPFWGEYYSKWESSPKKSENKKS